MFRLLRGDDAWNDIDLHDFLQKYGSDLRLHSESAVPPLLCMYWYLAKTRHDAEARDLLRVLTDGILLANRRGGPGLMNPYFEGEDVVRYHLGMSKEPVLDTFQGASYTLDSLLQLLARNEQRPYLEAIWRPLSHIQLAEFHPDPSWETYLYRADHGSLQLRFPEQTQSWAPLVADSNSVEEAAIPEGLTRHACFLPLLLLAFPHRLRPNLVKYLDGVLRTAAGNG